jgi:dTDP-4-dehydrorhamnose reductase
MRVLILGVTGMLGNAVFKVLSEDSEHEVRGTIRSPDSAKHFPSATRSRLVDGIDVLDRDALVRLLDRVRPEAVINCTGIIKQLEAANDPLAILPINAMFPHQLAGLCGLAGARLISLSSDCVYSGRKGNYEESDPSDAEDLYGKSKHIGEVLGHRHAITLRTSGIGHELGTNNGLLEWFLSQEGKVKGYAKAIYSGIPSVELARTIRDFVLPHPELHGLYHISAKPVSKFELLTLIAGVYGKKIAIERDDSVAVDRSLNSRRFTEATGYIAPEWPALVALMHAHR